ncbi:type II toxin-antitoxin system HicA family toxin [Peijinzhouia sedimentorum]
MNDLLLIDYRIANPLYQECDIANVEQLVRVDLIDLENATKCSYFEFMSRREKLIARFLGMPSDFHYDEMVKLLGYFGFEEVKKGKTSGSRVKFENVEGVPISSTNHIQAES